MTIPHTAVHRILPSLLLFIVFSASYAQAAEPVGVVTAVEGVADILHPSEEKLFLKDGDQIYINDRIRAKSYSKVEITFRDNSVLKIAPGSCVTINEYALDKDLKRLSSKITLTRGKLEAVVSKTSRPETFVIDTPNARGTVKGSDIFVSFQSGTTGVFVKEGAMSVANQALPDEKLEVRKGDCAFVPIKDKPGAARPYMDAELSGHEKDVLQTLAKKWIMQKGSSKITAAITNVSGNVRIYKKGASGWRKAKLNEVISEGDKLQAGEVGWADIRLSNGNRIMMLAETELIFSRLDYDPSSGEFDNEFESARGKIKAVVDKMAKKSAFKVKTPTAIAGVRGTVMYLNINTILTQAAYEGGPGFIGSPGSNAMQDVAPGQTSSVNKNGVISVPVNTPVEQKLALDESFRNLEMNEDLSDPQGAAGVDQAAALGAGYQLPLDDSAVTADNMSTMPIDMPVFDQVFAQQIHEQAENSVAATVVRQFSIGKNMQDPTIFGPFTINITIMSDHTWTGTIADPFSGATTKTVPPDSYVWWVQAGVPGPGNDYMDVESNSSINSSVSGSWTASSVTGNFYNADLVDHSITNGSGSGAITAGAPNGTLSGTFEGDWS